MISTKSTNVASLLDQMHELVDRIGEAAQTAAPVSFEPTLGGRNADLVADYANVAALVSRLKFEPVYSIDRTGISFGTLHRDATPMGLIELFYVLDQPKVIVYLYEAGHGIVVVNGRFNGRQVSSQLKIEKPAAVDLLRASKSHPSIHLLRRLQIAGVR